MPDTPRARWIPAGTPLPSHGWATALVLAVSVLTAVLLIQAGLALAAPRPAESAQAPRQVAAISPSAEPGTTTVASSR